MSEYKIVNRTIDVDDYMLLRELTLGKKERECAQKIVNSWFCVYVTCDNKTIGTGRIIGDGGLTFQITDIMVRPDYQGKGVGKMIMNALMTHYKNNAPQDAYLSLMADGDAKFLYERYGFKVIEKTVGMKYIP